AAAVVVQQEVAAFAQDQDVGAAVVVVVAGDRADRARCQLPCESGSGGHIREASAVVPEQSNAAWPNGEDVDVAVGIEIEQRDALGGRRLGGENGPGERR